MLIYTLFYFSLLLMILPFLSTSPATSPLFCIQVCVFLLVTGSVFLSVLWQQEACLFVDYSATWVGIPLTGKDKVMFPQQELCIAQAVERSVRLMKSR